MSQLTQSTPAIPAAQTFRSTVRKRGKIWEIGIPVASIFLVKPLVPYTLMSTVCPIRDNDQPDTERAIQIMTRIRSRKENVWEIGIPYSDVWRFRDLLRKRVQVTLEQHSDAMRVDFRRKTGEYKMPKPKKQPTPPANPVIEITPNDVLIGSIQDLKTDETTE